MAPFCCRPECLSWGVSQDPWLNLSKLELINFYPNQPLSQVLYFSEWVNITTSHLVIQTGNPGIICDSCLSPSP